MITKIIDDENYKFNIVINPHTFEPEVKIFIDNSFIDSIKENNIISKIYTDSLNDINYSVLFGLEAYKEPDQNGGTTNVIKNIKLMIDYYPKTEYSIMDAHIEMANRYIDILRPIENIDLHLDKVSNKNLLWMANKISTGDMLADKASRWLGYIQGVMATKGYISVDQERDFSRPLYHLAYGNMNLDIPKSEECNIK